MTNKSYNRSIVLRILNHRLFFRWLLAFFVFECLWIALSSVYPMAFDEDFHLGIIRLYASHISPFWAHQPAGADVYGAVARDPSFLYQYLLSFPYRLITLFTHSTTVLVIILRLINIALGTYSIILFRKLLYKTNASKAMVNLTLLLYTLIPVVPFLSAQINYDNLFILMTALALIMTIDVADDLFNKKADATKLIKLTVVCLIACLVKYAFLPIAAVIGLYIFYEARKNLSFFIFVSKLKTNFSKLPKLNKILLSIMISISIILFTQRYIVNIVRYHTPVPDCSKILTVNQCKRYGPWIRDYNFKINRVDSEIGTEKNLVTFILDWFYGMWLRTFFTVSGPNALYQSRGPLPIPSLSAVVFAGFGIIAFAANFKKILIKYNKHHVLFLLLTAVFYIGVLWLDEFKAFRSTGQPVAINGRYIFPVLPFIMLILIFGYSMTLRKWRRAKSLLALVCVVCFLWGGGLLTFILRSNDAWYFDSRIVRNLNHAVQKTLGPVVPGNANPAQFLK